MRYVNLNTLRYTRVNFRALEVFPEAWTNRRVFSQYKDMPRPLSSLFLVCGDILATFYPQEGKPVAVEKGNLLWIPAGSCYHMEIKRGGKNSINSYTLNFQLLDENGIDLLLADKILLLAQDSNRLFETYIKTLNFEIRREREPEEKEQQNWLKIQSTFFSLLASVADMASENAAPYYPIRLGVEALKNEWNLNRKIEEYAEMCDVSSTYFYQCFHQWSNESPVSYRNKLRLSNAEVMLRCTNMKVKEISEAIGFNDPFYFCRYFTKHFGVSPKKYREIQCAELKDQ